MPRGQKVSRLLATSSKFLVANAQFLVALATSQSQCRTLSISKALDRRSVETGDISANKTTAEIKQKDQLLFLLP